MFKYVNKFAIGGLFNVGYSENTDMLIVLSNQGRGVFNCLTGELAFRDEKDWFPDFDKDKGVVQGFGSEVNKLIKISGINSSNKLNDETDDDWKLILTDPEPDKPPFEKYNIQKIYLNHPSIHDKIFVTEDGACELRAFGFSDTQRSFVVALSCEITIWARI